jgi:probable addiction module antidote protein
MAKVKMAKAKMAKTGMAKTRMAKTKAFDAAVYLDSREAIAAYLSEAFETHDAAFITEALGTVARAQGMSALAKDTGLSRENLYKALSPDGHPEFSTVMKVLDSFGVQLHAEPKIEKVA